MMDRTQDMLREQKVKEVTAVKDNDEEEVEHKSIVDTIKTITEE